MSLNARNGPFTFAVRNLGRTEREVRPDNPGFEDTPLEQSGIDDSPLFPQKNNKKNVATVGNVTMGGGRAKRVKNVKISGSPAKTGKSMTRGATDAAAPPVSPNDEVCHACGESGKLICCDNCPKSYHFNCVDPPIESVDDQTGDWYCNPCRVKIDGYVDPDQGGEYFRPLLLDLQSRNPSIFRLPLETISSFNDIQSSARGTFLDSRTIRPAKLNRGWTETNREPYKVKDKNGRLAVCYHCRLPGDATERKQVVQCDFCDQVWHLDCLTPPLVEIPSVKKKWMCPLHVEHDQPTSRWAKTPSEFRTITEPGQPNNGRIEVIMQRSTQATDDPMRRVKYQIPEETIIIDFLNKTAPFRKRRWVKYLPVVQIQTKHQDV
ncbi:hypothetical protein BT69DRAFT_640259 [Atractiella rhizophila]|nr:hypothetical protein BT69DRAFT_640259 [Atractiella rhizophila]